MSDHEDEGQEVTTLSQASLEAIADLVVKKLASNPLKTNPPDPAAASGKHGTRFHSPFSLSLSLSLSPLLPTHALWYVRQAVPLRSGTRRTHPTRRPKGGHLLQAGGYIIAEGAKKDQPGKGQRWCEDGSFISEMPSGH